jgi:hypothetical protein
MLCGEGCLKGCDSCESYFASNQPDSTNIPSIPLNYWKEVGIGTLQKEAQELAYHCIMLPLQQELLSWHHISTICHSEDFFNWHNG